MPDPQDSFKRKVPVDEMVERIRHHRSSGGQSQPVGFEVLGDGDEQVVVEVRRRRIRRSKQPKRKKRKREKAFRFFFTVGLIPVALLIGAVYFAALAHYQSKGFGEKVSLRLADAFGCTVDMRPLVIKGFSVTCPQITVIPDDGHLVSSATFRLNKADMKSETFFSSDWHMSGLIAVDANFNLRRPDPKRRLEASRPLLENALAGIGLDSSPDQFHVGAFHVENVSVFWPPLKEDEEYDELAKIISGVSASSSTISPEMDILLSGGRLDIPGWPVLDLTTANLSLSGNTLEISKSRFKPGFAGDTIGRTSITGILTLDGRHPLELDVKLDRVDIGGMIIADWQHRLSGRANAEATITAELGRPQSTVLEGSLSMKDGVLANIPNLQRIADYVGEAKIGRLEFDELTADFRRSDSGLEIRNIEGIVPDLFHLRGNVRIDDDRKVSGSVDIGIALHSLEAGKYGKPSFFGEPDITSLCWTTVKLGGKLNALSDDLADRFKREIEQIKSANRMHFENLVPTLKRDQDGQPAPSSPPTPAPVDPKDAFRRIIENNR